MRRLVLIPLAAILLAAPAARASDPIMRLSSVRAGMHCTGLTVVQGTTISSFNADVVDVVDDIGAGGPTILIRTSGPAVDVTGIADGFSGSPIYCKDTNGVSRNVGAIAYGLGDYGNKLALVTPIEAILSEPVTPPASPRRLTRRERASIRPLAAPVTIAGLTPLLARRLAAVARARGQAVYPTLAGPLGSFPPQQLRPGASLSVGLSSGDLAISAIGTVTYTDGSSVWGFGHPLDAAGRRGLLLQDAYVYTVVNNPNGDIGVSYKLAAPGHDLGTLTGDTLNAVTGRVGALPPITDVTVHAKDLDTGKALTSRSNVADEIALGPPVGFSPLEIVAPTAVADAGVRALQSYPARETDTMCLNTTIAGHSRPLRFCNRYVNDQGFGGAGLSAADDVDAAVSLLDTVQFSGLRVLSVSADLTLRRELAQAYLQSGTAAPRVRAGHKLPVMVKAKVVRGATRKFSFAVTVPPHLVPGRYRLMLSGQGPDGTGGGGGLAAFLADLLGGGGGSAGGGGGLGELGPTSFGDLASQFAQLGSYDGLTGVFVPVSSPRGRRHSKHPKPRPHRSKRMRVYRDPGMRIGGHVAIPVRVTHP